MELHIRDAINTLCAKPSKFYTILDKNNFYAPGKGLKFQRKYIINLMKLAIIDTYFLKHWKCPIFKPLQYKVKSTHTKIFLQKAVITVVFSQLKTIKIYFREIITYTHFQLLNILLIS